MRISGSSIENAYINTMMALDMGYKFVDTAVMYGNEHEIGIYNVLVCNVLVY